MALTYTPEPELGSMMPEFILPATDGSRFDSREMHDFKALCVMFICNHCPYVQAIEDRLVSLGHDMIDLGVRLVAISSNDANRYADDSFANMKIRAMEKSYPFPYLYDESQAVAKTFGAVCTPDFFVYDADRKLAYRGRLDDSWKDPAQVKSQELKAALVALSKGEKPAREQKPSMGCSIKWKSMDQ
jgi:peroxiredoxin